MTFWASVCIFFIFFHWKVKGVQFIELDQLALINIFISILVYKKLKLEWTLILFECVFKQQKANNMMNVVVKSKPMWFISKSFLEIDDICLVQYMQTNNTSTYKCMIFLIYLCWNSIEWCCFYHLCIWCHLLKPYKFE